jgi:hypothetical protein
MTWMIGNDLIVAAPWIIFAAGLSAVWIQLLRARHVARRRPGRSPPPFPGPGGSGEAEPGRPGSFPATPRHAPERQETAGPVYTQEGQCTEKNTQGRWR